MNVLRSHISHVGLVLSIFAVCSTSLVVFTKYNTRDKIIKNERQTLLKALNAVIPRTQYNNKILGDTLYLAPNKQLGTNHISTVYRARLNGMPVAAALTIIAPDGYNGTITILVGIAFDGRLIGVRVIQHKETPGLGDKIDIKKTAWILNFRGLYLFNSNVSKWKVKKDGGALNQFTGATVTPRAVVTAIKKSLFYFDVHRNELFAVTEIK
ncbi:MAG: electron transport complex subunit RsxG [Piscirickettsiaceae bacterium]|nr:electron transport complex subunit RsxG [Piscirickettsiaceae bacterium]